MDWLSLPILAIAGPGYLWYAVPLIICVSLVYAATRHEQLPAILQHAGHVGVWILSFMTVVFAILLVISWFV